VVDRANLKSILDEHKLTEEGLVNPENAKKLGQFSGVDAIIIGNLSVTDTDVVLLVKAISTDTAEVVAAGRVNFPKTSEFQQLLSKGILPGDDTGGASVSGSAASGSAETSAIATKEIGRLRIALKNVAPLREKSRNSRTGDELIRGFVCSFEFTNLDLRETLKVAYNGERRSGNCYLGRSKLTDSAGKEWTLFDATGLPMVATATTSGGDPTAIARLIQTGEHTDEWFAYHQHGTWGGDFVSIEPGKTDRVTMKFCNVDNEGRPTDYRAKSVDFFQLESELIVCASDPGNKEVKYSLEALVLDKVIMPKTEETQESKSAR
jgi:hypothetical protein